MGAAALSAIGLALAVMGCCLIVLVARTMDACARKQGAGARRLHRRARPPSTMYEAGVSITQRGHRAPRRVS